MRKKYKGRPPKIRKTVKGKNVNKNKFFNLYSILGGLLFGDKKNVGNVGNVDNIVSAPSFNIGALKLDAVRPGEEKETVPKYNTGGLVEVVKNYNKIVNEYITNRSKVSSESGKDIKGAGVDTQLIAAQPGEVVINKETVDKIGVDYFLNLNKRFGGEDSNKPKEANVQAASGGGIIESLRTYAVGGVVEDEEEVVNSTVSKILGLDFSDDFTKDELQTLLKEFLVKYQEGSAVTTEDERSKVNSDDLQKVREEFIRLKKEKSAPEKRYRVTKRATRGTFTGFGGTSPVEPPGPPTSGPTSKMLPGVGTLAPYTPQNFQEESDVESEKKKKKKPVDSLEKNVGAIRKTVDSIFKTLSDQSKFLSSIFEKERKVGQNKRRAEKEEKFESKGESKTKKVIDKVVKPFSNIFDGFLKFITTILLGKALIKLVNWFGDPNNQSKVESIGRFLKDFWPALLGAYLIFGNSLGKFVASMIGTVTKMTFKLLKFAIPKLYKVIRKNPIAAAAVLGVAGAASMAMKNESTREEENKKDDKNIVTPTETREKGQTPSGPQLMDEMTRQRGFGGMFSSGGLVPFKGDDSNLTKEQKGQQQKEKKTDNPLLSLFGKTPTGMAINGANKGISSFGSSIKEKGLGNAAMDLAGGAFGNIKDFMDEKGISDVLMEHPLAKMDAFGLGKGKEEFANLKGFMDEKDITDNLMAHPLAKIGMFGMDQTMNFGKDPARDITGDPARDITGDSGTDIKGAGVDTQLISAQPGDVVINKEAASAVGPNYFDTISSGSGEKISGAGPDTQMIATRPGEIVINRETVNAVGADHFLGLNRVFGGPGANKPKTAKVQAASGGGYVLPTFSSGGMVGGYESSQDSSKEGNSASNKENAQLLKQRSKDIKEEKKEKKSGGGFAGGVNNVMSAIQNPSSMFSGLSGLQQTPSKSLKATLAREDAAVEAALAKEAAGKVVGRENLPAATQKILAEMDAKRSGTLPPDIKTTKKGGMPDMGLGGLIRGVLGTGDKQKEEKKYGANLADGISKVMGAIQNPLSIFGMFGGGEKKIVDGNIGKPTAQEQKDFDNLAASKEKLKQSQQKLMGMDDSQQKPAVDYDSMDIKELNSFLDPSKTGASMPHVFEAAKAAKAQARAQGLPEEEVQRLGQVAAVKAKMGDGAKSPVKATTVKEKSSQDDSALRAEYDKIQDDPKHPLFEKVRGGYDVDDFGMRFSEFKDFKAKESVKEKVKSTFQLAGSSEVIDLNKPMGSEITGARHAQLMKSTDPQRIADYDAKNGEGAYSKKLLGKLKNTYVDASDAEMKKIVGKDMIKSKAKTFVAGKVNENSGIDIPGGTADRQLIKAQPGEYMLPADTVTKLGGPNAIDSIVARTDSNSTAAKLGTMSKSSMAVEQPVTSEGSDVTTLPPIVSPSGDSGGGGGGGGQMATAVPKVTISSNSTRMNAKSMYGLIG